MADAAEILEQQRQSWDAFAPGWAKWDHLVARILAPISEEMLRLLAVPDGAGHLDVAAGTGEPGLSIASRAPSGRVVLADLSSGMLDVARQNADRRGIANVEIQACSADDLPFGDASFDSVSCRLGLMFVPDPAAAVRELARVLRPGGRLCVAVWAGPEDNPWATIPMQAIGAEIDLPAPPPDAPGLFRCAAPGSVGELFEAAGLGEVREVDVRGEQGVDSAEEFWTFMSEVAGPIVAALGQLDAAARRRVDDRVLEGIRGFAVDGSPRLPMHARCVIGTR